MARRLRAKSGSDAAPARHGMSFRVSQAVRQALVAASEQSGRSISQEAELRLEMALRDERGFRDNLDHVFGPQGAAVLQMIGFLMRQDGDWIEDPMKFALMRRRIGLILDAIQPPEVPSIVEGELGALGDVRQIFHQLFARNPNAVWLRWHLELRERLGDAAVGRIMRWLRGPS